MKLIRLLLILTCTFTILNAEEAVTPDKAMEMLKEGNSRYLSGKTSQLGTYEARRMETKSSQSPFATILGCSDSRVPIEIVFDQGIGNIFKIAVAGNVMDKHEMGSIEYSIGHLKCPLVVVMGHTKCGAVTAAATNAELHGSIPSLIEDIKPSVDAVKSHSPNLSASELVPEVIKENVIESIATLLTHSKEVRELIEQGKLKVVGAIYDIETGSITWVGPHPEQEKLLKSELKEPSHGEAPAKEGEKISEEVNKPLILKDIEATLRMQGIWLALGFLVIVIPSFFLVIWLFDFMKGRSKA